MKKTAVIYTRVSTDLQAEKGFSLRDQKDKLRRYCDSNNIQILQHFQEDYSAKDFNRPEWKLLMVFLRKNKKDIDFFMFAKWDRFSRNLMEGMQVLSEIKSLGIVPYCLETNVDDSVPENLLIQTILLTIPEIENARRSQNTIAGIRQALKEGRWPRKPPMGYLNDRDKYNNKTISIDPPVALIVRKAFQEAAKGKKTLQDIRVELNKEGLKCNKSSFSKLLRNQFYIGKVFVPAYKDEPEQIVMGVHDPIIDEGIFYKVQEILEGRKLKRNFPVKQMAKPELPLRGYMLCSKCNEKMTGSRSKGNGGYYFYYHCNKCGTRVKADVANEVFEKLLKQLVLKNEVKELLHLAVKRMHKGASDDKKLALKQIEKDLAKQQKRKARLDERFIDEQIGANDYTHLNSIVKNSISNLHDKMHEIKSLNEHFSANLLKGLEVVSNLQNIYEKADIIGRRRIIGSTFPRKFVFEEKKVRTNEMNEVVRWMIKSNRTLQQKNSGQLSKNSKLSALVAGTRFELMTFGL